jgi:hypothetical protein
MGDFIHAAWPVAAILGGAFLVWAIWRFLFSRSCWRCRTPPLPQARKHWISRILPIARCGRCDSWRGNLY